MEKETKETEKMERKAEPRETQPSKMGNEDRCGRLSLEEEGLLIRQAREGDKDAGNRLALQYRGLLYKAAMQPHLRSVAEDALGAAQIGFCEAIAEFDSERGIPFAAFVRAKVYGEVHSFFRRELRKWQREVVPSVEEDCFWEMQAGSGSLEEESVWKEMMRSFIAQLTDRERKILQLIFFEERRQGEAANLLVLSQQTVSRVKKAVAEKLRKFFGGAACGAPA